MQDKRDYQEILCSYVQLNDHIPKEKFYEKKGYWIKDINKADFINI
jgi:hypothetical protein